MAEDLQLSLSEAILVFPGRVLSLVLHPIASGKLIKRTIIMVYNGKSGIFKCAKKEKKNQRQTIPDLRGWASVGEFIAGRCRESRRAVEH